MRRLNTLVATGLVTALAISALAVPASAATNGRLTLVNGIPGTKIDICTSKTKEIRSGLKYGGVFKKQMYGKKQLVFRKASPGKCKGKVLTSRSVKLFEGSDKTVVVTSKKPDRVLVFDNTALGTLASVAVPAPPNAALALRHAGDLTDNEVYFRLTAWSGPYVKDGAFTPAAADVPFTKGDEYIGPRHITADQVMRIKATRVNPGNVLAKAPLVEPEAMKRYEWIFVGNKASNAKVVPIISKLSAPPAP